MNHESSNRSTTSEKPPGDDPAQWPFVRDEQGHIRVALPVIRAHGAGQAALIRSSRMSRRRAIVLALVQILMIVHVVQWLVAGKTITPIEPSESIQTVSDGVINAGAIFFALALLATLILGRWVCGWGCHIVMLQDLCAHLMKRCGIRPKPFRSRLLIYIPLIIAMYMFIWPLAYRFIILPITGSSPGWPGFSSGFVTSNFWETFAGIWVAIPFLLVCGFATVYFLGAKGFCTYGCPYGGFFAPLDRLAVGRIRVNENCDQSGHCTAVCTSNVRVHENVRDFGMVVDPGCMKCMDCISVCPNNALYFGIGKPALLSAPRTTRPAEPQYDVTWAEEIGCAIVFALVFFTVRGAYSLVPLLMAAGIAGCVTFIAFKCRQLYARPAVALHRFALKKEQRLTGAGWVWSVASLLLLVVLVQTALVQYHVWRGSTLVPVNTEAVFAGQYSLDAPTQRKIGIALGHLKKADAITHGGIGLFADPDGLLAQARMYLAAGQYDQCEKQFARALQLVRPSDLKCRDFGRILVLNDKVEEAVSYYSRVLEEHPGFSMTRRRFVALLTLLGRTDQARKWDGSAPGGESDH